MQEREEYGYKGNTWLFFGDQHFTTDFLYQTEWQEWLKMVFLKNECRFLTIQIKSICTTSHC